MGDLIRIIIADDKERFRQFIKDTIDSTRVTVIGEAGNGRELLSLLNSAAEKPDIILLDLEMPVMDGNKTFDLIKQNFQGIKVIIVSFYFEDLLVEDYLERGANGYLPKDTISPEVLMNALLEVHADKPYIYEKPGNQHGFTRRQVEILPLIFEGKTNGEIAGEVHMAKRSVEKQRQKIYQKSGAEKMVDFYKFAFTRGLQFLGRRQKLSKTL